MDHLQLYSLGRLYLCWTTHYSHYVLHQESFQCIYDFIDPLDVLLDLGIIKLGSGSMRSGLVNTTMHWFTSFLKYSYQDFASSVTVFECSFSMLVDCIVLRVLRQRQEFSWLFFCLLKLLLRKEAEVSFELISSPWFRSLKRILSWNSNKQSTQE